MLYALAWLSFGLGHSLLTMSNSTAAQTTLFGPYYRLAYNLFAVLHIFLVWFLGRWLLIDMAHVVVSDMYLPAFLIPGFVGWIVLLLALREYDLGLFVGTTQIKNNKKGLLPTPEEPLVKNGLHAYVRHPIYAGAYLILWGGADNDFGLATAIWGSIYLAFGTYFEERKLLANYGSDYAKYRSRVPAIIPWRGKVI